MAKLKFGRVQNVMIRNKKRYFHYGVRQKKSEAIDVAKMIRQRKPTQNNPKGFFAMVVKRSDGYHIYSRGSD